MAANGNDGRQHIEQHVDVAAPANASLAGQSAPSRSTRKTSLALIFSGNATLFTSAKTPYDRQTLFAHASHCARRYGSARVELEGKTWSIAKSPSDECICTTCGHSIRGMVYRNSGRQLCTACAGASFTAPAAQHWGRGTGMAESGQRQPESATAAGKVWEEILASSTRKMAFRRLRLPRSAVSRSHPDVHPVQCHYCRNSFDLFAAPWCSHAGTQPSKRCPHCQRCVCEHPSYSEPHLWKDAPGVFRERGFTRLFLFYL